MKKLFLMFVTVALMSGYSFALTPPQVVKTAFDAKFPSATKVSWGKESAKEWEADFVFEGTKISAVFNEDGTWMETEKKIYTADLPKAVLDAIRAKYVGWRIVEVDKTESAKHGSIYEADLKKGTKKKGVAFKEDGTLVNE